MPKKTEFFIKIIRYLGTTKNPHVGLNMWRVL